MSTRLFLLAALLLPSIARADDPKFVFVAPDGEAKSVVWKASAQAGGTYLTGNANALTLSGGAAVSRWDGKNKLALDLGGAYVRSTLRVATDVNGNGKIDGPSEISEQQKITAEQWNAKLRYDRFFTKNNSAYLTALAAGDVPAGKDLVAGGQIGYSRQLWKDDTHQLDAELGYDFSFVEYVSTTAAGADSSTTVHSVRGFLGAVVTPPESDTNITASIEVLDNLNPIANPAQPNGRVDSFADVRVAVKLAATTKVYSNINFRLSFTMKYESTPGPAPSIGIPYASDFIPAAQTTDTITEVALVITFL